MESHLLDVGRHTLRYLRSGQGQIPMLLLHGFTDDAASWGLLATDLAPEFDIVAPDMTGHGESQPATVPLTIDDMAQDVIMIMSRLGLAPAFILGHSMGAAIAALVAAKAPDLVRGLILEDPPWRAVPQQQTTATSGDSWAEWRHWLTSIRERPVADGITETGALHPSWHPADVAAFVHSRRVVDLSLFDGLTWRSLERWRETVSAIRSPLLLLTGDPDKEAIVTSAVAAQVVQLASAAMTMRFEGAGHQIHRDLYPDFLAAVRRFLEDNLGN